MSPLEDTVMRVIWAKETCTADEVRQALLRRQPMKDSTVRTILRRLEAKGYVSHEIDGRTYVYRPRLPAPGGDAGRTADRRSPLRGVR